MPAQRNRPMVRPMNTPGIVPATIPMRKRSTVAQVSPARSALRNRSTMVATTTVGAGRMRTKWGNLSVRGADALRKVSSAYRAIVAECHAVGDERTTKADALLTFLGGTDVR